jgi:hypothetical protein
VGGEEAEPLAEAGPQHGARSFRPRGLRRIVEAFEHALYPGVEVFDDREEHLMFAAEVEVEGATGYARPGDDVADSGVAVSLPREDPGGGLQQLLSAFVWRKEGARPRCLRHGTTID